MANHYFPGDAIPTPITVSGYSVAFNNAFVKNLGKYPGYEVYGNGYDPNRPFGQRNGAGTVIFNLAGEGKAVKITIVSAYQGASVTLWCPDHPEDREKSSNGNSLPWIAYFGTPSSYPYRPGDAQYVAPQSTIEVTLRPGVTYYLEIGSSTVDNSVGGVGYDQDFTLRVALAHDPDAPGHYWPGKSIPVDHIPDQGLSYTFDNRFCKDLPGNGLDTGRPKDQSGSYKWPWGDGSGVADLLWNVVSATGRWVDFYVLFMGQGGSVGLWQEQPDGTWDYAPMPGNGAPMGPALAAGGGSPTGNYQSSGSIRVYLAAGVTYILRLTSAYSATEVAAGAALGYQHDAAAYDQDFHMEVYNTPLSLPDLKSNAWEVIIPRDGATYNSTVLNTNFTVSAEDVYPSQMYASAWWHYKSASATDLDVSFAIIPSGQTGFACNVWQQQSNGTMVILGQSSTYPPQSFHVPGVAANADIYIQVYGNDYWNDHQSYSQWYQLGVTGAKSIAQKPNPLGPDNDLRAHAIAVSVGSDDLAYLSDDTTLTYATPGAVGADPWPLDKFGHYANDTEAAPLYQTAWWSYKPIAPGLATVRAHSNPADAPAAQVMVLDSTLALVDVKAMGQDLVFQIETLHTYYIVLGTKDPGISLTASFVLHGQPTAGAPPVNDLRSHAIPVSIQNDGDSYLATNTQLDYATPAAVGAIVGQYLPDPEASPLYQTAWWSYKPTAGGTVAIRAHSDPADDAAVKLMILHNLTPLATVAMTADYTHPVVHGDTYYYVLGTTGQAFASASFVMTGPSTVVASTTPDPTPPPIKVPPISGIDPYQPGAVAVELESGTATLLDLVRAFSSAVRRAVRITGPNTIEMVNPGAPLPTDWHDSDADSMYVMAGRSAAATTTVLSLNAGDVTLTATAQVVADDVRIPASTWRIPDRLPLYGLPAAAVQRVTYTFSPQGFTASLDLHYTDIPLIAKGDS